MPVRGEADDPQPLLPLAARHVPLDEWNRLGEEGRNRDSVEAAAARARDADVPRNPEVVSEMLRTHPIVPRLVLLPRVAPGIRPRYAQKVTGTRTP